MNVAAIEEASKRLVQSLHPLRTNLLGSHTWETPGADSGLNLVVKVADSELVTESSRQRTSCGA